MKKQSKPKIVDGFLESLVWQNGRPFCPCCMLEIEACHWCKEKTAREDTPHLCPDCIQAGNDQCRICKTCLKEANGD